MQERKIIALLRERGRAGAARPAGTRWAAVRYVIVPILRDVYKRQYFCRSFFLLSPAGADHIFIVYPESISLNAPLQDHKSTYQTSEETQHECIIYIPGLRQKPGEHRADDGPVPAGRTYRAGGLLRQRRGEMCIRDRPSTPSTMRISPATVGRS